MIYTSFIGGSIAGLGDISTQLQRAIGASERLLEILHEQDEAAEETPAIDLNGALEFDQVSVFSCYPQGFHRAERPELYRGARREDRPGGTQLVRVSRPSSTC